MNEYGKWVFCLFGMGAVAFFMQQAGVNPDVGKILQAGWFVSTYIVLSRGDFKGPQVVKEDSD